MSKQFKFIVVFMPDLRPDEQTVDKMAVVDCWESNFSCLESANNHMIKRLSRDEHGIYSRHGDGTFTVYRSH